MLLRGGFCLFLWSYFMFLLSSLAKGKQQITDIHHLVLWGYIQTSKITLLRSVELEADSLTAEETRAELNWAIFWVLMVTFKRKYSWNVPKWHIWRFCLNTMYSNLFNSVLIHFISIKVVGGNVLHWFAWDLELQLHHS